VIERLVAALAELGLEPSAEDVQDALWLALRAGDFDVPTWSRTPRRIPPTAEAPEQAPPEAPPNVAAGPRDELPEEPRASVVVPSPPPARSEPQAPARTIPVAGASPLPGTLEIARAIRPLRRRVPSRFDELVDEEATSDRTARDDLWIPVMRPMPSRWLELALVVDGSPSMAIWAPTVRELLRVLEREGAFRDVRSWNLLIPTGPTGRARLRSRTRQGTGTGPFRDSESLVDPTGTRLILVLTDGVSRAWRETPLRATMARWSRAGPVGIVQLLPERLWPRVALRTEPARVSAPRPGAPSAKLRARRSIATEERAPAVPVMALTPEWLKPWSELVAGANDTWVPGAVSYFDELDEDDDGDRPVGHSGSAQHLVERFRATASPTAYRLAGYLAAVHLTVPVMHLVRRVMLPTTSGLDHLAEVFLSGLIVQRPLRQIDGRPAEVDYDFLPGVRDLLLNGVLRSEASLVLEQVGDYIEEHDPDTHGIRAALADRTGTQRPDISERSRPFATVTATVLRRLRRPETAAAFGNGDPERGPGTIGEPPPVEPPPPPTKGTVRVGLLGAVGSGKTTFLAALGVATMQQRSWYAWTMLGGDPESTRFLSTSIVQLRDQREFPSAGMEGITRLSWRFLPVERAGGTGRPGRRRRDDRAEFMVELLDLPGTYFLVRKPSQHLPVIIDHLATSKGLVYLFDPVRELQSGNSFRYFGDVMDLVVRHHRARDRSGATRLPHRLAVCVTKFDDPKIFELARNRGWVSWSDQGTGAPRVPEERAKDFFDWICHQRPDGSGNAVRNLIGSYFHADRVAYFVSSSIGFYASEGGNVDPGHYSNVDESGDRPRIRGEVRPINVLEPFIWLERSLRTAATR
jgi:hypothetical protein